MGDNEFKAGRADIMEEVNSEKPVGYDIYANHVNSSYVSEQRFGFYTSFADFAYINMIYKGQSCTVYIAKCKYSRGKVVLKAYELSNMSGGAQGILKTRLGIMQEIMAPARYQSSCNDIVRCFGFFEDRAEIVFVLEYCARSDIMSYLRTQDMSEANLVIEIVQPVLRCLEHLHINGFTHGNICPENILLTADGFVKVTDLDSMTWKAGMGYPNTARLQEPSLEYMSPEVVMAYFPQLAKERGSEMSPQEAFTPGCDIWSLGAMVYELCTGQLPFNTGECDGALEEEHSMQTALKIIHEDVRTTFLSTISPEAMSFVQFAMTRDLNTRPSVEDLMLHPWIQKFASVEVATMFDEPAETFEEFAARGDFGIRSKASPFARFKEGLHGVKDAIKTKARRMVGSNKSVPEEKDDSSQ